MMTKCIDCKYYIADEFCKPYQEKDYDFEIDGEYSEHNCSEFKEK